MSARMGRALTPIALLLLTAPFAASAPSATMQQPWTPESLPPPASPGAMLVTGGLMMMGAVLAGLVVQGAPARPEPETAKPRSVHTALRLADARGALAYRGPRDEEFERGHAAGRRVPAFTLDELFDRMVETELGEPRVLRSMPNFLRLRLHACRGCAGVHVEDGCAFECGFLEAGLGRVFGRDVLVHEIACRAKGAAACEFEVWH